MLIKKRNRHFMHYTNACYAIAPPRCGWEVVKAMAKVIQFYSPDKFWPKGKWVPPTKRGKIIQFPSRQKKSCDANAPECLRYGLRVADWIPVLADAKSSALR